MENLNITLIQTTLVWENIDKNLQHFSNKIAAIKENTDLIVLPEMFSTGFSMHPEKSAEPQNGKTLKWMKKQAELKNAAVCGSIIIEENSKYYNRLFFVHPNGDFQTYDKRHLFSFSGEHKKYESGTEKLIVEYKGWKICPLICYDLRFPVWARNTENYDVLIYGANWPTARILAWDTLLRARSIENLCYTIGVSRIGTDPNNNNYIGHSAVYDAVGEKISTKNWESDFIETLTLTRNHIKETRKKFQFLKDKDDFHIT